MAQRKRRRPLTRESVLEAAVRLADRAGIDGLSMRTLGRELHVEAMSLYNHVRDKDDILDGMVGIVFEEIETPVASRDWKAEMRRRAISVRQALLRHPWAIGLMESRAQPVASVLQHHDAVLGSLRGSGFPLELAARAYAVMDGFVYGFTMTELALPFSEEHGAAEVAGDILQGVAERYPHLVEIAVERAMKPGYSYGNEFEFGLDLILDGLDRSLRAQRP